MHNFAFELEKLHMMKTVPTEVEREGISVDIEITEDENVRFHNFLVRFRKIKDKKSYCSLRNILINHL